jgi:DedD protein
MAAPDDANLDDLRRRARRRLVGAIVLALAVAVFVPMLLESDPKPLGEDVSVKIPPVDEGKFVNRLNEKSKTEAPPKAVAKAETKVEPPKPAPPEPPKTEPPKTEAPKDDAAKAEAPKDEPAKVENPKAEPPKSEPSPVPVAKAPAAATKEPAKDHATGDFAVQVFAFSDDKGANSLVNKLKGKGFPAYSEPVSTSRGTLWRVRVGPYVSRETAGAARDKLKGEGYNGIVAAAK